MSKNFTSYDEWCSTIDAMGEELKDYADDSMFLLIDDIVKIIDKHLNLNIESTLELYRTARRLL